jgi:hypothetical protein
VSLKQIPSSRNKLHRMKLLEEVNIDGYLFIRNMVMQKYTSNTQI